MIVTLTANPSLDRAVSLAAALQIGEVQTATGAREDAGGKGINVARVVAGANQPSLAVLPLADDDPFAAALAHTGIPYRAVPIAGHARANLTIVDPAGETTKLNLPGATFSIDDRRALIDAVADSAVGARWLVLAGSLPPGAGSDFYVDVIEAVRERCGSAAPRIALDTSGDALHETVERGHPDLIKPNDDELAALTGEQVDDPAAVVTVARTLVPAKVGGALVTLGAAGAVLVRADDAWIASPPTIRVRSTVGAGDSSLAGYLLAESAGGDGAACLVNAIRYGAAAAALPGTQAPTPHDLPSGEVAVRSLHTT